MNKNPFQELRKTDKDIVTSYNWYIQQIRNLARTRLQPSKLLKSSIGTIATRINVGSMYLFMYDPKLKATLPVYDRFPLVLPFQKTPDGFLGLNLHYLPYMYRAQLLTRLYRLRTNPDIKHPTTRLRLSWDLINNAAQYPGVKICVKRYLKRQLRSNFLEINPIDWRAAIFLPIEDFQKMSKDDVFKRARSQM